jgi:hypothetical protein
LLSFIVETVLCIDHIFYVFKLYRYILLSISIGLWLYYVIINSGNAIKFSY